MTSTGPVRRHAQRPLARTVTQGALEPGARLEYVRSEGARAAGGNGHANVAARGRAAVVDAGDGDLRCLLARVHQAQPADLFGVAAWVEDGHVVVAVRVRRHDIVHRRQKAVAGRADVGQHLDVQIARQRQPPVAGAGSGAHGQALGRVAVFQIRRIEVDGLVRIDVEGHRPEAGAAVVVRLDMHFARPRRVVDDAHEPLADPVHGGREHRHQVIQVGVHRAGAGVTGTQRQPLANRLGEQDDAKQAHHCQRPKPGGWAN